MVSVSEWGGMASLPIADAAAEEKRAYEARDARVDVNDGAASEVKSAHLEAET